MNVILKYKNDDIFAFYADCSLIEIGIHMFTEEHKYKHNTEVEVYQVWADLYHPKLAGHHRQWFEKWDTSEKAMVALKLLKKRIENAIKNNESLNFTKEEEKDEKIK